MGRTTSVLHNPAEFAEVLSWPRGAATPRMFHDAGRILRGLEAMFAYGKEEPMVLAHGDTHPSNLFVDADNGPGLLDWTSWRCPWIHDVAYFIAGGLDVGDRRRWEAALLSRYLAALENNGVKPPTFDHAWLMYRRWCFWGICVWLNNTPEYHTEQMITAMTTRYVMAGLDHDAFALVGV